MIKKILVPLDGSKTAEAVLPYAATLAKQANAELILLSSVFEVVVWDEYPATIDLDKQIATATGYLESKRKELEATGLRAQIKVETIAFPADAITEFANEQQVDLIAMSSHGRSGIGRWIFGSVADKVLHSTTRPLLLVSPDETAQTEGLGINKILVPLDGSELSQSVLPFVEDIAQTIGASLVLLHAIPPIGIYSASEGEQLESAEVAHALEKQAAEFLDSIANDIKQRGIQAEPLVTMGYSVQAIIHGALDCSADMIALSTHGRSGVGRWMVGSVTDAVVRRSHLPCLIIRPGSSGEKAKN